MPSSEHDATYMDQRRFNDEYLQSSGGSIIEIASAKQAQRTLDAEFQESGWVQQVYSNTDGMGGINGINGIARQDHTGELPALQVQGPPDEGDNYEPLVEAEPGSYDLVAPSNGQEQYFSLEKQSLALFSKPHLQVIFSDPSLLLRFTAFVSAYRPQSVPLLVYYLDALKAIRAIRYANAVTEAMEPLQDLQFTAQAVAPTENTALERRADEAFQMLVNEELPAYITHLYINVVSQSISRRITGTLPPHLREASEGLAEVFCLTDPSRKDNPIVFASEEFHRTTQYGMDYVLGRNCRFLQGPSTNQHSVRRVRSAVQSGKQHQETFLNYRRDGSPFVNLLMMAPLCDSRGKIRYFIGAQVDVSGLVKDCTDMESLQRLLEDQEGQEIHGNGPENDDSTGTNGINGHVDDFRTGPGDEEEDEFRNLSEMFNLGELSTVRRYGGRMHTDKPIEDSEAGSIHKPRLLLRDSSPVQTLGGDSNFAGLPGPRPPGRLSGKLSGVYKHYLLVRPYPSLRILFASPSQRVPGMLQSLFLSRIGGSPHVREELEAALAEGRGVTAKIKWISSIRSNAARTTREGSLPHSRMNEGRIPLDDDAGQGRTRWIHCTPLIGAGGTIGVWMVVMVIPDEDKSGLNGSTPRRLAPPVRMPPPQSNARVAQQLQARQNDHPHAYSIDIEHDTGVPSRGIYTNQRYNSPARHQQSNNINHHINGNDHDLNSRMGDISIGNPTIANSHNPYFYGQKHGNTYGYSASITSGRSRGNSLDGQQSMCDMSQEDESLTSLRIG